MKREITGGEMCIATKYMEKKVVSSQCSTVAVIVQSGERNQAVTAVGVYSTEFLISERRVKLKTGREL